MLSDLQLKYLRLIGREYIEDEDGLADERDSLWQQMSPLDREELNEIVEALLGATT